ncbi:helix-turn-helix domain-containing protein (plasmid) [Haladaptatus sp. SPP-AMP-3]|uniref:helix-turn-helix domain-containing protein n=1 Tax=Haladaptatus sp. SPP-AMP-3 TaxID=3121295 RepID=UPI003C2FCFC0
MATAKLTITIPTDVWVGDLSANHPTAEFRVLAALPAEQTGVGLLELTSTDIPSILREMAAYDDVLDVEPLRASEETALVRFETTDPILLLSMQESGVPLELPITFRDGEATLEVTASHERLSTLGTQLELFDIAFDVEFVREMTASERLLTERQRQLLTTAVECGYYDSPRTCTLTDLAAMTDVAKSTASETLHRAEGKVIKQYVGTDE